MAEQEEGQPMEVNHLHELDYIVDASENWLRGGIDPRYHHFGSSVDLYQFSYDQNKDMNNGYIFHANKEEDLTFGGEIDALSANNKRGAVFMVHEADEQEHVEDMMSRSLRLKHVGIGKAHVGGYNTQLSKIVSGYGYSAPTCILGQWLEERKPKSAAKVPIPPEVRQLIRTGYQAIEAMWAGGCTSDHLANVGSYHMVDDFVKIDPMCIRDRNQGEDDMMPIRHDFSDMIRNNIYTIWVDAELEDLIDLLKYKVARGSRAILRAPVLLLPDMRELMYHTYDTTIFPKKQFDWLKANAYPGDDWKTKVSTVDPALKSIIDYQVNVDDEGVGFSLDFEGVLHFASVVTGHYQKHFKDTATNPLNVDMKTRVDSVLKKALPRLLSKIYNSEYACQEGA